MLETPSTTSTATTTTVSPANNFQPTASTMDEHIMYMDDYDIDSSCSTPYVSAPSSPGRGNGPPISGFYYSAPASPMHFMISASSLNSNSISSQPEVSPTSSSYSFEFDFSASKPSANGSTSAGSMSSADELFLNGQIRPMKLSTHLQRPQVLAPLLDIEEAPDDEPDDICRGRDFKMRDRSLRRRTRSMSPLRTTAPFGWHEDFEVNSHDVNPVDVKNGDKEECAAATASSETTPCESGASSRSSSVGRSSSRWVFLKEFLYRSKSEGRNNGHKFWGSLAFSPVKDRKIKMEKFLPSKITSSSGHSREKDTARKTTSTATASAAEASAKGVSADLQASEQAQTKQSASGPKDVKKKAVNGVGKRRVPPSPHELHYTANRAQAEELRKKTFLPYRQGLFGCLGFSSKSYGAMNGFARALNPVSSR